MAEEEVLKTSQCGFDPHPGHARDARLVCPRGRGVGARLVEGFADWGRARGAARLQVGAYVANTGALRFYQRHGFAPLSTELVIDL
jgi:hypothetical protein